MAEKIPGAYILTHEATGLTYVGSTGDLQGRYYQHNGELKANAHHAKRFQEAFNQSPSFVMERIPAQSREHAYDLEQELLDKNWGNPSLTNTSQTARGGAGPIPEEVRKKMSDGRKAGNSETQRAHLIAMNKARAGRKMSDEQRQAMSEARKGIPKSEEHKRKIAEANTGKKMTPDAIVKRVASRGPESYKNFRHTEESKAKISTSRLAHHADLRNQSQDKE